MDIIILHMNSVYFFSNPSCSVSGKDLYKYLNISKEDYVALLKNCGASWNFFGMPFFYTEEKAKEALNQLKFLEKMVK
jgi:hypothetical protein